MVARRVRYVEQSEGLRARRWKLEESGVRLLEWSSEDLEIDHSHMQIL
jgi:hypothetical protein